MTGKLLIKAITIASLSLGLLPSCGKVYDQNGHDWEPELPLSDSVYNREIQIYDLGVNNIPEGHRPLDAQDPMFFSLERLSSVHVAYRTTHRWDIAFSGLYSSGVNSNNGSVQGLGYGSSARGGIMILDSAYSEVKSVPAENLFDAAETQGLAGMGDVLYPSGYAFYTFFENIFRPEKMANLGSSDPNLSGDANRYMHMMYCMSEEFAKNYPEEYGRTKIKVRPRTVVVRTAAGNYAKIEFQSMYKGIMDSRQMYRANDRPLPYHSFKYMVIKADERRFGFVARKPPLTINLSTKKTTVGK